MQIHEMVLMMIWQADGTAEAVTLISQLKVNK
jgi:hypothetical protein